MKRKIIFIGILIIMIYFSISGICSIKNITYEDKYDLIKHAYSVLDQVFGKNPKFFQINPQIENYDKIFTHRVAFHAPRTGSIGTANRHRSGY